MCIMDTILPCTTNPQSLAFPCACSVKFQVTQNSDIQRCLSGVYQKSICLGICILLDGYRQSKCHWSDTDKGSEKCLWSDTDTDSEKCHYLPGLQIVCRISMHPYTVFPISVKTVMYWQQKVTVCFRFFFLVTVMYRKIKYIALLLNHIMQCEYTVLDRNSEVGKGCNFTVIYCFFLQYAIKFLRHISSNFNVISMSFY